MKLIRLALCVLLCWPGSARSAELKPIEIPPGYEHSRWGTLPRDIVKEFCAYTTSFDSADDDDGDEIADVWAIPEWIAYEIKRYPGQLAAGRP